MTSDIVSEHSVTSLIRDNSTGCSSRRRRGTKDGRTGNGAAGGGAEERQAALTRGRGRTAPMGRRRRREAESGRRVRSGDGMVKQAVSGATRGRR
jgi:hypothetical protein